MKVNIAEFQHALRKRDGTFDRIVEWKNLADKEENNINRFIFRWISFNGLYFASYAMDYTQEKAEYEKEVILIKKFCDKFILTDKILASKIYSDSLRTVFEDNIKETSRGMGTCLKNLELEKSVENKVSNMVEIAYKIRCRLFHGEKNPNLEVNLEVCEGADQVIASILNHIIEEKHAV